MSKVDATQEKVDKLGFIKIENFKEKKRNSHCSSAG